MTAIITWGSSLGGNNQAELAERCKPKIIHGCWGFQASDAPGADQRGFPDNVLFAHEVINPNIMLGSHRWWKPKGQKHPNIYITIAYDAHPGDQDLHIQNVFIEEMRRVIKAAGGEAHGFGLYGLWGPVTNPGERYFSARVRDELGVNIYGSPYRDYQLDEVAATIRSLPE